MVFARAILSSCSVKGVGSWSADGGALLAALIRTGVLSECGCALLGGCRRVYLSLLAEASRLLCL